MRWLPCGATPELRYQPACGRVGGRGEVGAMRHLPWQSCTAPFSGDGGALPELPRHASGGVFGQADNGGQGFLRGVPRPARLYEDEARGMKRIPLWLLPSLPPARIRRSLLPAEHFTASFRMTYRRRCLWPHTISGVRPAACRPGWLDPGRTTLALSSRRRYRK